jgi:hypothetical protein
MLLKPMPRVVSKETWIVSGDIESIWRVVRAFFKRNKMRLVDERDEEMEQGSQFLTRVLGGWSVPAAWLPKRARVLLKQVDDGVLVQATIEESLGFGVMGPVLAKKYQKYFDTWLDDLRDALKSRAANS